MATAPQWPRPATFDDEVNEPLVLVDRFKQHYLSVCHHTADNPMATAPASYVMDVMFQANKVITLLAKQMNLGAGKQHAEAKKSANTAQVGVQDAPKMERETRAPEGGTRFGRVLDPMALELAGETVGTIYDFKWGDGDSEGDRDWEDDDSSERDSEDEYYEYGDFEDEEEVVNSNHENKNQSGQGNGIQAGLGLDAAPGEAAENSPGGTIHDLNWGDQDSNEDPDWQDTDSSVHDSEDEYYEYGDFEEEDEEKPNAAGGEQQADPQVDVDLPVEEAHEAAWDIKDAVSDIHDAGWGDEDSEGDQDWEDNGSSDHDSEDDYYEYGDFGDDEDPEDEDQHEGQDGQPNRVDHQLENDTAADAKDQEKTHPTPSHPPGWRDAYDWISSLTDQEIPVHDSKMLSQLPLDPGAPHFMIRWGCVNPPYKGWRSRAIHHDDIINELRDVLAKSSILELREVRPQSVQPYHLSGDLVVHLATHAERTCLFNHAKDWLPRLQQGHSARIPRVYYPGVQPKTENTVFTNAEPTPTIDTSPNLPGLRIRWGNNAAPYKAWNSQMLVYDHVWRHLYSALRDSGHPELPGMQIPFMDVNEHTGDVDVFLNSQTDRDILYDTEGSWVPLLEQGQHARIMFLYDPEKQQQSEPILTTTIQHIETLPFSRATTPDQPPPLKIHWDTDPPYRGLEDTEQARQDLLSLLLKFFDPSPEATRQFNITINPETGDVDLSLSDEDYKYALQTIPQWLCLLDRSEGARIPGIYNPLRRAKSRAKNTKKPRLSSVAGGVQAEASLVADGSVKDGPRSGSPSSQSQSRSERQLERRRTKRRQRWWERKVQRNAEVLAG